jgi:hypothetical protein
MVGLQVKMMKRLKRLFLRNAALIKILIACPLTMAATDDSISLADTKSVQDPFQFSRQLDYRHFAILDYKGADFEDVTVYQVRYTHPVAETDLLKEQFIRVTTAAKRIPVDITLNGSNEPANQSTDTGMGDTNIFDAFTMRIGENYKWGIGPSVTLPTNQSNGDKRFGNDNWRAGIAGIGMLRFSTRDQGILIFNWQKDVYGDDVPVEQLNFQPAFSHSFSKGWYLMSSGIWQFDLENDTHYIPVALGFGKVFRYQGKLMHAFIEPQWVVDSDDMDKNGNFVPQPKFLVRLGLTLMFSH